MNSGKISIVDLEVFYRVGVPDAERAQPQRLLLTIELESDFTAAAKSDGIADTIDYYAVTQRLLKFGEASEAALRREIKEETNLKVSQIEFVLVQDCIHSKEFYRDAHFVLLNYTCRVVGKPNVKLNHEAQEFRWLKIADAKKLKLNKPTKILLAAVIKRRK